MSAAIKTSISLPVHLWEKMKNVKNKSAFIAESLELFIEKQSFLKSAEKKYWENVQQSIHKGDGDYFSVNPDNQKVDENLLEESLWK